MFFVCVHLQVHLFDPERSCTVSIITVPADVTAVSHLDPAVTPAELVFEIEAVLPTITTTAGSGGSGARLPIELAKLAGAHFVEMCGAAGVSVSAERSVMQDADDGWCFRVTMLFPAGVLAAASARDGVDTAAVGQFLVETATSLADEFGVHSRQFVDGIGFADGLWPSRIEPFCLALGTNLGQVMLVHPRLDEAFACYREMGKPLRRSMLTTRPVNGQAAVEDGLYVLPCLTKSL